MLDKGLTVYLYVGIKSILYSIRNILLVIIKANLMMLRYTITY